MTSLGRLKNIFRKYLQFFKNIPQNWFRVISVELRQYLIKKDVGPLETLKKWNVFGEQCIAINQVCHEYQWADICVRVLPSQWSSKPNKRYIIYYF